MSSSKFGQVLCSKGTFVHPLHLWQAPIYEIWEGFESFQYVRSETPSSSDTGSFRHVSYTAETFQTPQVRVVWSLQQGGLPVQHIVS